MRGMNLKTISLDILLKNLDYLLIKGDRNLEVSGIAYDSRRVQPGNLFVCIQGLKSDGHDYIYDAYARGAVGIIVERPVDVSNDLVLTIVQVLDSRVALAQLAVQFYNYPSQKIGLIGITGTNGKTTTAHLIESILQQNEQKTGLIGTIANRIGTKNFAVEHTTPESLDLQCLLNQMVYEKVDWAVMEVSSHALSLHRVDGTYYDLGIFTNLTQDHLDFHGDFTHYLESKLKLFSSLEKGPKAKWSKGIINLDDSSSKFFIQAIGENKVISYGLDKPAQIRAEDIETDNQGVSFQLVSEQWREKIRINTPGLFSVYNALAAISTGLALNIPKEKIVQGVETVQGVPGRFESVDCGQDFAIIIDFAHTPDGLKNILQTAKQFAQGKIILVFGCGGDRDKTKRPLMGEIAARFADRWIITSDNPRSEDPNAIIEDIVAGVRRGKDVAGKYEIVPDRREAIFSAVLEAKKNDLIIIAGKGHENYQILRDRTIYFDDREVVKDALGGGQK